VPLHPADQRVSLEQIDKTVVVELRYEHLGHMLQRRADLQGSGQLLTYRVDNAARQNSRQPCSTWSLAELRAQARYAPDQDTARVSELGQVAGNSLQIGQPFFLIAFGLVCPADASGPHRRRYLASDRARSPASLTTRGIMMANTRKPSIPPVIALPS